MPDVADRIVNDIVAERYGQRQVLARSTAERAQDMWSTVDQRWIDEQWLALLPRLVEDVSVAQLSAAARSDLYVESITRNSSTAGRLNPLSLAGIASDGRPLASLLYAPATRAKIEIAARIAAPIAMEMAGRQLAMIVATQVSDAGRVGDGAAIATRENTGYIRELRTPSCARCIVLAGVWYEWNTGFQRHPRCDCVHRPATRKEGSTSKFDPQREFDSMSAKQQDQTFTEAGAQAIRDGADIGQVVNARRGMSAAGTIEGTTRRGFAGRRMATYGDVFDTANSATRYSRTPIRLMPEQIYAMSSTRADAVTALRRYGFIV